MPESG